MSRGYHRVTVGDCVCTIINEGTFPPDDDWIQETFRAPEGLNLMRLKAEYEAEYGTYYFGMSPLLIEVGERRILVDAAMGVHAPEPLRGLVIKRLGQVGVQPEMIDTVIISHLDEDHFMGLLNAEGEMCFPNAQILIGEHEIRSRSNHDPDDPPRYEAFHDLQWRQDFLNTISDRIQQVNPGDEIAPGVTIVKAYGHRPGQIGVLVQSGEAGFLYMADAAHIPIQFKYPALDITHQYDFGLARQTRLDLFNRAADENLIVMAYHFGFPCVGRVERAGDAYKWLPVKIERDEPEEAD